MEGEKKVPALFKSFVGTEDTISIQKITTLKEGWMIKSDFDKSLGFIATKVFPTKSSAIASANGEEIISVNITWNL
jgi:hypothetical protein